MALKPPNDVPAEEPTSLAKNPLYDDKPLPPHSGATGPSIRLLRPDLHDARSWCLEVLPLAAARRTYKALSYRWGTSKATVKCDGHDLVVTENLELALPYLRNEFSGKGFWIDAICINQKDETEKAHQVRIMDEIYAGAEEVLIWLEPSLLPSNVGECFEACRRYALEWQVWERIWRTTDPSEERDLEPMNADAIKSALRAENPFSPSIMNGLFEMLHQPYWSRIWVIQEMSLAKNMRARLLAKEHSLPWPDLRLFLLMVEYCMGWALREMNSNFRGLIELSRRLSQEGQTRPRLAELLVEFRWSGATDPRDKVYGLLGLVSADDRELISDGISDQMYQITTEECYIRVTFELLRQTRDLSLLIHCLAPRFAARRCSTCRSRNEADGKDMNCAECCRDWIESFEERESSHDTKEHEAGPTSSLSQRRPDLPTWVPDWSYDASHIPPPKPGLMSRNPYHRLGDIRPRIYAAYTASAASRCPSPTRSGRVLTLQGMIFGPITTVCRSIEMRHQYPMLEDSIRMHKPSVPGSWDEVSSRDIGTVWNLVFLLRKLRRGWMLYRVSTYRKGEVLDIYFEWAALARLPWKTSVDVDTVDDPLTAMFTALLRGHKGCDVFHGYVTSEAPISIPTVTRDFRQFENSLRWNPVLRLLQYYQVGARYPKLYYLALGISYDIHRGAIPVSGVLVGLLLVLLTWSMRFECVGRWVSPDVLVCLQYLAWILFPPMIYLAKPKHLDSVLASPLDYAMARLKDGRMALVPYCAMGGDEIALLSGASCPFVVRAKGSQWELVGDCYVNGMMEGHKWKEKEVKPLDFL